MNPNKRYFKLLPWLVLAIVVGYSWYTTPRLNTDEKSANGPASSSSQTKVCGSNDEISYPSKTKVLQFAQEQNLRYKNAFANTIGYIRVNHRLPDCYLSKNQARRRGWTPGQPLWDHARGESIGGDYFGNRENRLPQTYNKKYKEADVDYDGRKRGARRLVYAIDRSSGPRVWLTVDHYRHFIEVPE